MPGRPRKNRKKELGEVPGSGKLPKRGKTMSCSACKSKNHNIRTCSYKPPVTSESIATSQASTSGKREKFHSSHPSQAVQQYQAIVESDSGNNKGANNASKRPRVVGHGVFVGKSGIICAEQGRSVSRVIKSGAQQKLISSAVVTGDLGYLPKGIKWKGKKAITGSQLQHRSALLRDVKTKSQTSSQSAAKIEGV